MQNSTVTDLYDKAQEYQEQYCDLVSEAECIQKEIVGLEERLSNIRKLKLDIEKNYLNIKCVLDQEGTRMGPIDKNVR